ncbi:hypothetical protein QQ008_17435 [Fulvivirgaceae bacterium BMA10]|uniref:Sortilin N-terminal domain-containing protein n=1 Tax=Splendidivirga corallicola TaxID=3051826 RepID=A0ABT8KR04_9BACT|nr:hypothetical protein [Fulvivirgaceae bacterium BMA10]
MNRVLNIFGVVMLFLCNTIYAQEWYDSLQKDTRKNFLLINRSFLLDSTPSIRGMSKEYLKWTRSIANELDQYGNLLSGQEQFENILAIQKEKENSVFKPDWKPFTNNRLSARSKSIPGNKGLARLHRVYPSPQNRHTIYAAMSLAGLWRSNDQGKTWQDLTNSKIPVTGVWAMAEHPQNPNIIVLGDKFTLYRTEDAGETWRRVADTTLLVRDIYFNHQSPNELYAASEKGIYHSSDTGKTWKKIFSVRANAMRMNPKDPKTLYVTEIVDNEVKIWVTHNGGATFEQYDLPDYEGRKVGRTRLDVSKAAPDHVYMVTNNIKSHGFGALYISRDKGRTWQFRGNKIDGAPYSVENPNVLGYSEKGDQPGGQLSYCFAFAVSQTNPDEMYVAGISMWKSTDGGKSWQNHSPWYANKNNLNHHIHADIHDIYATHNDVWVGHDGGISFSNDKSKTFTDKTGGINALEILGFDINFHHPEQMVNASMHVGSMFFEPESGGWFTLGGADDNYGGFGISDVKHFAHGAGYVHNMAFWEKGLDSIDNNATLSKKEPNGELGIHTENHQLLFQGLTEYNGTVDNNGSTLYRSTDFGRTWQLVLKDSLHSDDGRGHNARAYAAKSKVVSCWNNPDRLYYKNGGRIYESVDEGHTWTIVHDFNSSDNEEWQKSRIYKSRLLDIAVDPIDDNALYITMRNMFNSKVVMKSMDGGRSWEDFSQGIPSAAGRVNSIIIQRGTNNAMYVGTHRGVYYRNADMDKWMPYHTGLPVCDVIKLTIDYKKGQLVIGTFGRGIWRADLKEKSRPDVRIAYNNTEINQGGVLKLVDYSVLPFVPEKYEWKIKGEKNYVSNDRHPEITLQNKGDYTISLRIWDKSGYSWSNTLKKVVTVQ